MMMQQNNKWTESGPGSWMTRQRRMPMSSSPASGTPLISPSRRRLFFSRTLLDASVNSLASINTITTILPQYSVVDSSAEPGTDKASNVCPSDTLIQSDTTLLSPNQPLLPIPSGSHVPPRYSMIASTSQSGGQEVRHFEHSFPIRANKPWATLHMFSSDLPGAFVEPQPKRKQPRFLGGEPIMGMVELDLESPLTIQQITVKLRGKIVTGYLDGEGCTFLDHETLFYHKFNGDPRPPSAPSPAPSGKKKFDGRLSGSYQFPFSFPFPTQVDLESASSVLPDGSVTPFSLAAEPGHDSSWYTSNEKGSSSPGRDGLSTGSFPTMPLSPSGSISAGKTQQRWPMSAKSTMTIEHGMTTSICPTPQSFLEQGVTASVQYELSVHFVHGRLRPDSKIKTIITYIPSVVALPASLKRQEAYEAAALIPGPLSDPEGWFTLPETTIQGQLGGVNGKPVKIDCILHLAKPLSYTRGTVIPCFLTLSSDDSHALSTLSTPKTPYIRLVRRIRHFFPHGADGVRALEDMHGNGATAGGCQEAIMPSAGLVPIAVDSKGKGSGLTTAVAEMGVGVWWVPQKNILQEVGTRHLEGEIHLAKELKPSNGCSLFSVEYFVEMLPFASNIFQSSLAPGARGNPRKQILTSYPVEIATLHTPGTPVPVAFSERRKVRRRPTEWLAEDDF